MLPHLAKVADDIAIVRSMHTDQFNHAPAQIFLNTGSPLARPAEHGVVGHLRPGQRGRPTCPASSCCPRPAGSSGGRRQLVERVPADRPTRACRSARKGDPILNVTNPAGIDRRLQRELARPDRAASTASTSTSSATPRSPRASPPTRWPTGCSPAPGADGPVGRDRRRRSTCTAPSPASRRSPPTACSPAGWSSAASGSSTSTTKAGTTTPTSPAG